MGQVRPFTQPLQESAGLLARAMMLGQSWDRCGETLVETGNVGRAYLFEAAELNVAGDDGSESPVVGAAKGADARYLQLFRVDQWLCGGAHLVVEIGTDRRATGAPRTSPRSRQSPCQPLAPLDLLLGHEGVAIVRRRGESFLDGPRANPADQVQLGTGLVVRSRSPSTAKRLLADDCSRWLVVDVKVSGSVTQR